MDVIDGPALTPSADVIVDEIVGVIDGPVVTPSAVVIVDEIVGVIDGPVLAPSAVVIVNEVVDIIDGPVVTPPAVVTVSEIVGVLDAAGPVSAALIVDAGPVLAIDEGATLTLQASVITLNPELATAEVAWGDGLSDQVIPAAASGAITALHLYGTEGAFTITVTVTGPFGDLSVDSTTATVSNLPPKADAGGPYSGDVGQAIALTAVGSDPGGDPLTYAWDLDKDGQFGDATGQTVLFSSSTAGFFPVAVRVVDDAGVATDASTTVTMADDAATDEPPPDPSGDGGPAVKLDYVPRQPDGSARPESKLVLFAKATADAPAASVSFTRDGTPIGSDDQFPFSLTVVIPAGTEGQTLEFQAVAVNAAGSAGPSATVSVLVIDAGALEGDGIVREPGERSIGKAQATAVIGTLVRLEPSQIFVGTDLEVVRVLIDRELTNLVKGQDDDAYSPGSRVIVAADGDVASGNAIALTITPIPSKPTRQHEWAVAAQPAPGNLFAFFDSAGGRTDAIKPVDINVEDGDQVVLMVRSDGPSGTDPEARVIARSDDVLRWLDELAQAKADSGDNVDSITVDRLRDALKAQDRDRVTAIPDLDSPTLRQAIAKAESKLKDRDAQDAADPLAAIRDQARREAEQAIGVCAARVTGKQQVLSREDLTDDELARVEAECLDADDRDTGRGARIPEQRDDPPPRVLDCIIDVLGDEPTRPLTDPEKERLEAACALGDHASDGPPDSGSRDVDERKAAFCADNPTDTRCVDDGGGTAGPDGPTSDAEKRAFCADNPTDARCARDGGGTAGPDGPTSDAEKRAFCADNPTDARCARDGGETTDAEGPTDPEGTKEQSDSAG